MKRPAFTFALLTLALAIGTIVGCQDDEDELGTPCDVDDDCSGDLICDVHEGQGTCQEPHDH
ncbi:hypothetical protein ACNOYE_14890 [Nannocystaceae bacterium ST9]